MRFDRSVSFGSSDDCYGIGSGSDRVFSKGVSRESTRSLPLPVRTDAAPIMIEQESSHTALGLSSTAKPNIKRLSLHICCHTLQSDLRMVQRIKLALCL